MDIDSERSDQKVALLIGKIANKVPPTPEALILTKLQQILNLLHQDPQTISASKTKPKQTINKCSTILE